MTPKELKEARQKLGLTQLQLAEKLGVTRQTVYYWEAGTHRIPKSVEKILKIFLAQT